MISPLSLLSLSSDTQASAAPKRVDADTFTEFCERPDAQRFIVDGSINGVIVDGAASTVN